MEANLILDDPRSDRAVGATIVQIDQAQRRDLVASWPGWDAGAVWPRHGETSRRREPRRHEAAAKAHTLSVKISSMVPSGSGRHQHQRTLLPESVVTTGSLTT